MPNIETMISLRHNRFWPLWIAVLALVFAGVVSPAQAMACAMQPNPVAESQPQHCSMPEQNASCCCHPGEKLSAAHPAPAGASVTAPGCGCVIHAPDAPPAAVLQNTVLVAAPDLGLLSTASVALELPRTASWTFAAPAIGPPLAALRSTGPSRAPPAP